MPPYVIGSPDPPGRRARTDAASATRPVRGDIEGLRAVAVVLVVAFHAGVGLVGGGFVGVDVFFVLSGFLVTGLLVDEIARTGTISLGEFYARRIRRLLPLATLVLARHRCRDVRARPADRPQGRRRRHRRLCPVERNWRFVAESTHYMADTDKSPCCTIWSLAVEEQFYLVWPLLLLLLVGGPGLAKRAWSVAVPPDRADPRPSSSRGRSWLSWAQTGTGAPSRTSGFTPGPGNSASGRHWRWCARSSRC